MRAGGSAGGSREDLVLSVNPAELGRAGGARSALSGLSVGGARPPTEMMVEFVDVYGEAHVIKPIFKELPVGPSSYHAARVPQRGSRSACRPEPSATPIC